MGLFNGLYLSQIQQTLCNKVIPLLIEYLWGVAMNCIKHNSQLPGGLFSPSDKWKKLQQPLLLHFPFGNKQNINEGFCGCKKKLQKM